MFSKNKNIEDLGSVLVFGGSFDPPHLGHKALLEHVLKNINVSKVIIIPCYIQPLKDKDFSSAEHRLAMSRIQFTLEKFAIGRSNYKDIELLVSDHEIKRGGASYTVDTVKHFRNVYPGRKIIVLMGEDSFWDIEKWKDSSVLFGLCSMIVVTRPSNDKENSSAKNVSSLFSYVEKIKHEYSCDVELIDDFQDPASSTLLRREISEGSDPKYLDGDVMEYINKKNLYKGEDV